jgi:hypothetical protein
MPFRIPEWKYLRYDIQQLWDRIALRRRINANPRIIIVVTNVSVIIFIIMFLQFFRSGQVKRVSDYKKEWFYDLNTGQLFAADKEHIPPIEAPSGPLPDGQPAGVRAYVFSYVEEPNESERFIGFLETADPNYAGDTTDKAKGITRWGRGRLIRKISDKKWVPADSKQGREIFEEALTPDENGKNPQYCAPK